MTDMSIFDLVVSGGYVAERWYTVDKEHAALSRPLSVRVPSTMPLCMKQKLLGKKCVIRLVLQGRHKQSTFVPSTVRHLSLDNMFHGGLQFGIGAQLHTVSLDSAINHPMHQIVAALPDQLQVLHIFGGSTCSRPLSVLQYVVRYPRGLKELSLQNVQDVQAPLPESLEIFTCNVTRSAQMPALPCTLLELYLKSISSEAEIQLPAGLQKLVMMNTSCSVLGSPEHLVYCEVSGRNAPQLLQHDLPDTLRVLKLKDMRSRFLGSNLPPTLELVELPGSWWRR